MQKDKKRRELWGIAFVMLPIVMLLAIIVADPYSYYLKHRIDSVTRERVAIKKSTHQIYWLFFKNEGILEKIIAEHDETAKNIVTYCDKVRGSRRLEKQLDDYEISCEHKPPTRYILFGFDSDGNPKIAVGSLCVKCHSEEFKNHSKGLAKLKKDRKKAAEISRLKNESTALENKIDALEAHLEWYKGRRNGILFFWKEPLEKLLSYF